MGKLQPRSFERIRSGEQIQIPSFANTAAAVAAGVTAAKFPRRMIYLSAGRHGLGAVSRHFGRHELAANRALAQTPFKRCHHGQIVSHHSAEAASSGY